MSPSGNTLTYLRPVIRERAPHPFSDATKTHAPSRSSIVKTDRPHGCRTGMRPNIAPDSGFFEAVEELFLVLLTNGRKFPPLPMVDEVIFSIKAITPALHRDYTGVDNKVILRNFTKIASSKSVSLHVETVFIPDYVDEDEVLRIADFIASVDRAIPFRIDAYLPIHGLPWRAPQAHEIQSLAEKARCMLPNTSCLYGDEGKIELAYEVERIF